MKKKMGLLVLLFVCSFLPLQANTKKTVTLAKCTDGDTAHFMVDGKNTTVRFLAINAPEYTKEKEPFGKEASEYVCDRLSNAKKLQLEYDDGSDEVDKYGRALAWVYVDGSLLQKELVQKGLAEVKYIYGDYAYTEELQKLEKKAKAEKLAMWSDGSGEEESQELPYYLSAAGGVLLILAGTFFVKGKRNKKRLIKQGMKKIKRK